MSHWWRRRGIRTTLTLWYGGATILVLAVYAASVFAFVGYSASKALDDRLRGDLRWAAEMVDQKPDGSFAWFDGDVGEGESPWLQVWTRGGDQLYRSALAERLPLPGSLRMASQHVTGFMSMRTPAGAGFRMLSAESSIGGTQVTIQVARPDAPMRREMQQAGLILLLGLPLGVAGAALGGYSLARRALAPVDRMADRAHSITAARLSDRLPVHNPDDELGRLASVFNEMLGRLELSFEQMRRFIADVSHELRTPLMAIRSVGDVGLREGRDASSYRRVIESMLEEVERLSTVVDRLLALSRAGSGTAVLAAEPIDIRQLADDVVGLLGVVAEEKGQSLVVEGQPVPRVRGDRVMLRQALVNIVDNAIKFTPRGGTIRVRVAHGPAGPTLEVSDTGPGIPAEFQPRMFERFQTGAIQPGERCGTGLGLSIAKWAVEANGAKLTFETEKGAGSTFRITLPAATAPAA
jgi:heavy metal sensor kinase